MPIAVSVAYNHLFSERKPLLEKIFSGTLRKTPPDPLPLFQSERIKNIELVIPAQITKEKINNIQVFVQKHHLKILSIHQPILKLTGISQEEITEFLAIAQKLKANLVVIHLFAISKRIFDPQFKSWLLGKQEKYQVEIALENSTKNLFTRFFPFVCEANQFGETMTKSGFKITMDITHLGYSGGNILEFYKKYHEHIVNIHLSDYGHGLRGMHLPLGKGKLPIKEFLLLLKQTRYSGQLTLEIPYSTQEVIESYNLVSSIL